MISIGVILLLLGTQPLFAAVESYRLDETKTRIEYHAQSTALHGFFGTAPHIQGRLIVDVSDAAKLVQEGRIQIDVLSMTTGIRARDHAMQRMFNADKFGEISFDVHQISLKPGNSNRYLIEGVLNIGTIEQPLTLDAEARFYEGGMEVVGETPLNLDRFKLVPPSFMGLARVKPGIIVKFDSFWEKQ